MNLEDVIDENGLQQDDWSLTKPRFGEEGQLQVVGWSGRDRGSTKWYVIKCSKCSTDKELYGEGYFKASKFNLLKPAIPCGCSRRPRLTGQQYITVAQRYVPNNIKILDYLGTKCNNAYFKLECTLCSSDTELFPEGWKNYMSNIKQGQGVSCKCSISPKLSYEQWSIWCKRIANDRNLKFIRLGEWAGNNNTPVFVECSCGVEARVCSIDVFKNVPSDSYKCTTCESERKSLQMLKQRKESDITLRIWKAVIKPDDEMIASFFKSGSFHPDTKFWRSDRKDSRGASRYWYMLCPDCGQEAETHSSELQRGTRSCSCSRQRQQEAYINWLIDEYNNAVAIKFGIARNSKNRIKEQNARCVYTLKQHAVYTFPSVQQCKQAERECKKELECGVVLKRDMPDGWTETTWAYNIGKVKSIYERNGGVLV